MTTPPANPTLPRVAIVGSTSGIASAVAHRLAEQGSALTLIARNAEALEAQASDLCIRHNATVSTICADLEDDDARAQLPVLASEVTPAQPHELSAVLIAAGSMPDNDTARTDAAAFARTVHLHHTSLAELAERFADVFQAQGSGLIAGIASVAGDRGRMSNYVYGAAKAAFATHLDGLRHRLAHNDPPIPVLTIKPGMVDTPMTHGVVDPKSPLVASPDRVARHIARAMHAAARAKAGRVVYTLWFWRLIMLVIRLVPEPVFKRTKL